jgi:tetratricopeptide (TPR) repeat protein
MPAPLSWLLQYFLPLLVLVYLFFGWLFQQEIFGIGEEPVALPESPTVTNSPAENKSRVPSHEDAQLEKNPGYAFRPMAGGKAAEIALGYQDALRSTRSLLVSGQLERAEKNYLDIIDRYPQRADAYGELANLYLSQGLQEAAAEAYLAAGRRIQLPSQQERYDDLMQVLGQLAPEKAAKLRQHHLQAHPPVSNRLQ